MNKRGQVVIFIIIGIVILLAVVSIFFIRSYVVEQEVTQAARPVTTELPSELEPIRVFTENCIQIVAEQALVRLGQQGGYIYPELRDNLQFDEDNQVDADGLLFSSDLKIPYWWYNKNKNEQNTITFASNRPTLENMEADLAFYLNSELAACLNDYQAFTPQNFEIQESTTQTQVSIVPKQVRFLVTHPLDIKKGSSQAKIENFYVEVPVELLHMYEIASLITETQKNFTFLENHALNVMTMFSGLDPNLLPPMADSTFETNPSLSWQKKDVVENLKTLFMGYVSFLRFHNSKNYYQYQFPPDQELQQRVYDDMVLPLEGAEDLEVRFQYLDMWDIYFDINAEGETIRPSSITVDLFIDEFGWQRYNNVYDISYPVFVSLHSPDSLEGTGYQFNLALESNLRNNQPAAAGQTSFPAFSSPEKTLLCKPEQRNSGNITIRTINKYDQQPLANTAILFTAGEETCTIGNTDEQGLLTTQFPIAVGGIISASKSGYLTTSDNLDTALDQTDSINLGLWKLHTLKIGALKKNLVNCKDAVNCFFGQTTQFAASNPLEAALFDLNDLTSGLTLTAHSGIAGSGRGRNTDWYFSNTIHYPQDNEQVIISLKRISSNDKSLDFGVNLVGDQESDIKLAPGDYEITIQGLVQEEYLIPAERRERKDEKFTIQEINIPVLSTNGLIWRNSTILTIKPSDLYSTNKINLFYLYLDFLSIPPENRVPEDLEIMSQLETISVKFKDKLEPVFT